MDDTVALERKLKRLSLSLRIGVIALLLAFGARAVFVLFRVPYFEMIFIDLLEGAQLPVLTRLVIETRGALLAGVAVLSLAPVILLLALPRRVWPVPLGILAAVGVIAVGELSSLAMQLPLIGIISRLSS